MNHLKKFQIFLEGDYSNSSGESFWGDKGAGILPLCSATGRVLVSLRSAEVNEPGTWGTWGGKMEQGENPKETAKREMTEECGYEGEVKLIPLSTFKSKSGGFEFHNFLGLVKNEFDPEYDTTEVDGYKWVSIDELVKIDDKHFGIDHILRNDMNVIRRWCRFKGL
jgi:8-oxo-dGTP pyrophosphatase MutT (NUDIX family)